MKNRKEWIKVEEAMEITGKSRNTIYAWCKKGVIECRRVVDAGSSPMLIKTQSIPNELT